MANPRDISDIIPSLDAIIERTGKMASGIKLVNEGYEAFGQEVVKSSKKITTQQQKLTGSTKEQQEQIEANAKAAEKLKKVQEDYKKAMTDNEKEIKKLKSSQANLIKQRNQEKKLIESLKKSIDKLKEGRKEESDEERKAKEERRENIRILKLEEKYANSAEGSYNKLSAQYSLMKIKINKLSKEERENTEAGKAMVEESKAVYEEMSNLQKQTGKSQLDVGKYSEAMHELPGILGNVGSGVDSLKGKFKAFMANPWVAIFAAIAAAVVAIGKAMTETRAGSNAFKRGMNNVTSALDVAKSRFRSFVSDLQEDFSEKGISGIIGDFVDKKKKQWSDFVDDIKKEGLGKAIVNDLKKTVNAQAEAISSFEEERKAVKSIKDNLIDLKDAYIDTEQRIRESSALLQQQSELLTAIGDDDTKSFLERERASEQARKKIEEYYKQRVELAKAGLEMADEEVKQSMQLREIDAATGKAITKNGIEVKSNRIDALLELRQAESDYLMTVRDNEEKRAKIVSDRVERDLDIQIDGFDNQKTINEQIIADDRNTLRVRFETLQQTKDLADNIFQDWTETIQMFTDKQLDMNDLIATDDAKLLNEKIRGYGLSEIWEGRLLEAVRERRTATNDLIQAERDLMDAAYTERMEAFDQEQELAELRAKNAGKTEAEITKLSVQAQIDRYKKELELAKVYGQQMSDTEIAIIEEKIKALQKDLESDTGGTSKTIWSMLGLDSDTLQTVKDNLKTAIDEIKSIFESFADARVEAAEAAVEAADTEVEAAENELDRQVELATSGYASNVEEAQKNLALAKETQAKAIAEEEKAQKQKEAIESAEQISAIITASANILKGWSSVPFIGQVLGIAAIAAMLGSFALTKTKIASNNYHEGGYEEIEGGTHASGNDTLIGFKNETALKAEKGESIGIFNAKARKKYGKILPDLVNNANKGILDDRYTRAWNVSEYPIIINSDYDSDSTMKDIKGILKRIEKQGGNMTTNDKKGRRIEKKGNITRIIS